ncbi:MAG: hypothetical protein Q9157_005862 [Trypethelium eluteriae]
MRLDDLIDFMSLRYGFSPTKRQYTYQFHKWNFRKYRGEGQAETSEEMNLDPITFSLKRSPPATICSKSSSLDNWTAKRRMLLPPVEFKNPFHGLGLPSDTIRADEQHLLSCRPDDYRAPAPDDFEHWTSQRQFNDPEAISLHIDLSQNIDEFSDENIYEMKRAADFLAALGIDEDAFALYVLILKRLRTSATCSDWMIIWTIISCSRMAYSRGQCEIARSLLKQRLAECPGSAPIVNQFTARMLLADTYARTFDEENERIHIEAAVRTSNLNPSLLSTLPHDHRSFDLYTYHFLIQKSPHVSPWRWKKSMPHCHNINKTEAQRTILYQRPGPFEIDKGVMANPCLRSCLQWTAHELKHLKLDSALRGTLDRIRRENMDIRAECCILFCRLWECWHSGATTSEHQSLWMTKAEKLMGISASILLRTVVWMLEGYAPSGLPINRVNDVFFLEWPLASNAQVKASGLLEESDETLAKTFLKTFSTCAHFAEPWDTTVVEEYAKQKLEHGLKMTLPAIIFNASDAKANGRGDYGSGRKARSWASMSTDSDLSSFRAFRDRIQDKARTMSHGIKTTPPSSVFRGQSTDAASLVSMDELSIAFRSVYLNSSGFQFGSTSTL